MRLNEFTDPSSYISTDADTENLLEQIETFLPARIEDDASQFPIRPAKRSPNDRTKPLYSR
jgi:hypothetical protein